MTQKRIEKLKKMLLSSRFSLYEKHPDFADLLFEIQFVATKNVRRISTNGKCIFFDPDWLEKLPDKSLDFILAHQLMHIHARHINRPQYFQGDKFHLACDIVANAHLVNMGFDSQRLPGVGEIHTHTFNPVYSGDTLTAKNALKYIPFDPATLKPNVRNNFIIDSEEYWDNKDADGKNGTVILCPDSEYPFSEKYKIVKHRFIALGFVPEFDDDGNKYEKENNTVADLGRTLETRWNSTALENLRSLRESKRALSDPEEPEYREILTQKPNSHKLDWRKLLVSFIQEDVRDYSFTPPDRRFADLDLFLPDYNLIPDTAKKIFFFVDTSGSVDIKVLSAVYYEIFSFVNQCGGTVEAVLAFFDTRVYPFISFTAVRELKEIVPIGGGGTSYSCIFNSLKRLPESSLPASIVIFTDGQATYPDESEANNIPVLWLFTDSTAKAPWGKSAYLKLQE